MTADLLSTFEKLRKREFYDTHERRSYARHWATAMQLVQEPQLLEHAKAFLERFVRPDPHQRHVYAAWSKLIESSPAEVAISLIEDSAAGAFLRETAPPFRKATEADREETRRLFP
jgi:hypothetical protein